MAEYIEREAFIEDIKTEIINLRMNGLKGTPRPHGELYDFIDRINEQPAADVAPVRHGKWKSYHEADIGYDEYGVRCSNCLFEVEDNEVNFRMHYCPNCGANMDGGDDNEKMR